jgi:DNA-directed RNA polymerase subunit K/omega
MTRGSGIPVPDPSVLGFSVMADTDDVLDSEDQSVPRPKAPPIESRFLYVDVAAMRAKQLRRGALPRLNADENGVETPRVIPFKAERVAMEEVRRGLVLYEVHAGTRPEESQ